MEWDTVDYRIWECRARTGWGRGHHCHYLPRARRRYHSLLAWRTLIYSHRSGPNGVVNRSGAEPEGGLRCFVGEYHTWFGITPVMLGFAKTRRH